MPWQQIFPKVGQSNSVGSALAGVPNFTFVVIKSNDVAKYFLRTPHYVERLNQSFTVYKLDKPPDEIIDLSRFKWKAIFYYRPRNLIEPIEFRDPEGFINAITDDMMLVINASVNKEFIKKMEKLYKQYVLGKKGGIFGLFSSGETKIDEELKARVDQKMNKAIYQTTIIVYGENKPALEKVITVMRPLVHPEMEVIIKPVSKKKIKYYVCPDGKKYNKKIKKCPDGSKPEIRREYVVEEKLPLSPDKKYNIAVNDDELDEFLKLPVLSSELGSAAALPAIKLPVDREKDVIIGRNDAGHPVGISLEEFKRHIYVLGRTGMGKSNTLELIANELVKKHGPNLAVWVVDPHGDMARDILLQVDGMIADWEDEYIERKAKEWGVKKEEIGIIRPYMSEEEIKQIKEKYKHVIDLRKVPKVYYFNPVTVGFQINPLELPKMENREMAILHTVNEVMGIFEKVFQLDLFKAANVRLLLKIGTIYLFKTIVKQGRDPTLPDLFRFYLKLFKSKPDNRGRGDDFERLIAEIDDPDFRDLLDLVRNMQEQSFISTIGRLYDFTITEDLRAMFSSNSVDFMELIKPGNVVLWDISKSQLPGDVGELIMSVIVMRLWFAIKQRKAEVDGLDIDEEEKEKMITPVILIIDEFQNIQRLQMIDVIFTEARKFGLHLVLAHQNLSQIDPDLLNTMLGNTAVQIIMAVSGDDAARLVGQIDWAFKEQLLSILPKLGKGEAIVKKIKMQIGQVADIPPQHVRIFPAPKRKYGRDYLKKVTAYMRDHYGAVEVRKYFSKSSNERVAEEYIAGRPLEYYAILWAIGKHMEDIFTQDTTRGGAKPTEIAKELGVRLQEIETILAEMEDKGYIFMYQEQSGGKGRPKKKYILTPKAIKSLIGDVVHAAPSPEGQLMLKTAINHYIKKSIVPLFITIPPVGGGREGADVVFIPFRREKKEWKPIPDAMWVVEVESPTEIESHKAQVRKNLTKKANAPFIRIDVWVYKESLEKFMRILNELPQVFRSKVKVVYVDEQGVPHDVDKEGKEDDTPDPPEVIIPE